MIEVLFGESEAGSMKAAKNTIIIGKTDGPTSVWMAGKKRPPEKQKFGWIEGNAEEVICLGFMLDIGDIREKTDSPYRKELIYSMYAQEQQGRDDQEKQELLELAGRYINERNRLKNRLAAGETVRVWYSNAPYSICGFYNLCSLLCKYNNPVRTVKLPEYLVHGNTIVSRSSWGEVPAEEFAGFLQYEKELSRAELRMYAAMWENLTEENSPLRTVVNGRVIGVPEDFYDFLIWKRLTKKPVQEAKLIGSILGYYPVGVGDWWYAKRIDCLIEQGKIRIVEDSERKYARIICLAE